MKARIIALMVLLAIMIPLVQAGHAEDIAASVNSVTTDSFMLEKVKYANTHDWGQYDFAEANFCIIIDGEPYLMQIKDGKVKEIKAGEPVTYDYKIVTSTKVAEKWWKIAEYYFEHGELTMKQKYWDIPLLKLQTPIETHGIGGNIAFMVSCVKYSRISIE